MLVLRGKGQIYLLVMVVVTITFCLNSLYYVVRSLTICAIHFRDCFKLFQDVPIGYLEF